MAAKMERTRTPGIFKRGSRYVFSYRAAGKQRWESYRTLDEARLAKAARKTDIHRGEFSPQSKITLHEYMREWIDAYAGTGRRGFREETRNEYRGIIEKHTLRFFSSKTRVTDLTPKMVNDYVRWLCRQPGRRGTTLSDNSVRNALSPLRAAMATARREGLIRHSPVTDVALPHRAQIEEDEDRARPFPNGVMELVVDLVHGKHRLMFELLAVTGVRRSELLALEGKHLSLNGEHPSIKIRQRVRRQTGKGLVIGPVKSKYSRREIPIPLDVADRLRGLRVADDRLVFPTRVGTLHDPNNLANRVLAPACSEAGVEWAGFHTFRHTVASRLFDAGWNVVQVQRWLGHHSPSFTLDTYVHCSTRTSVHRLRSAIGPRNRRLRRSPQLRRPATAVDLQSRAITPCEQTPRQTTTTPSCSRLPIPPISRVFVV